MVLNIDGNYIKDIDSFHDYITKELSLDKNKYGRNLDALWDELTSLDFKLEINMLNASNLSVNLGDYYGKILGMFMDLSLENADIDVNLMVR